MSTIGSGGDYTTIGDWVDSLPTTWVADYTGSCLAQAFNENITIEGFTEGSYTCLLTTNTGASLFDDESNALKYNTSYARVTGTVFSGTQHAVGQDSLTISKLQFQPTHSSVYTATGIQMGAGSGRFIKDILFDCQAQSTFTCIDLRSDYGGTANIARGVNILVIMSRDGASNNTPNAFYLYGGRLYNCGVVWPTGITAGTGNGISGTSYFNSYIYNTYVFNCSGTPFGTGLSGDYNATDAASGAPGINSDHSLTYANQFESTSSWDFRIKTGNNLEDNGNTDATYAPNDIFAKVRGSGTAGTIGPHETPYSAGGPTVYEVTASDGIYMDDGNAYRDADHQFLDSLFLKEDRYSDLLKSIVDNMLTSDDRFSDLSKLDSDNILSSDDRFSDLSKFDSDNILLDSLRVSVVERVISDYLFLDDSSVIEKISGLFEVVASDGLLLNDEIVKSVERLFLDNLFLYDSSIIEKLGAVFEVTLTDYVLLDETRYSTVEKTIKDSILVASLMVKLFEYMKQDSLFLNSTATAQWFGAVVATLVYAKINTVDLLGIAANSNSNLLKISLDSEANLLGIGVGLWTSSNH